MSDELQNGKIKNLNIYILLCLIFIISLYLFEVIIPFAVAFIIAYLVNPVKVLLDKYLTISILLFNIINFVLNQDLIPFHPFSYCEFLAKSKEDKYHQNHW